MSIMDSDYTMADSATMRWIHNLITFYEVREIVGYDELARMPGWLDHSLDSQAGADGLLVPRRG